MAGTNIGAKTVGPNHKTPNAHMASTSMDAENAVRYRGQIAHTANRSVIARFVGLHQKEQRNVHTASYRHTARPAKAEPYASTTRYGQIARYAKALGFASMRRIGAIAKHAAEPMHASAKAVST